MTHDPSTDPPQIRRLPESFTDPSNAPPAEASYLLLDFCLHWLASSEEPLEFKVPVLELLRSIAKSMGAIHASSRILTLFFAVLTNRKNCSDDVQFALALLDW